MIEATCGACGTVNRIAESDVPVGAKYMTCASCKSRVAIPAQQQEKLTLAGAPPASGGRGDIIDLADLPAPKKKGPLDGISRSAPTPTSAPMELDDLLAPVPAMPQKSQPIPKASPASSIADLPAPKAKAPPPIPKGPPSIALQGPGPLSVDDLPSAKPTQGIGQTTAGRPTASIEDLPAPRTQTSGLAAAGGPKASVGDLPQARTSTGILPSQRGLGPNSIADLPSPKASGAGIADGAPSRPMGISDLPAPKSGGVAQPQSPPPRPPAPTPAAQAAAQPRAITDLPAPRQPARPSAAPPPPAAASFDDGFADLPAPKRGGQPTNLPTPKPGGGSIDLPMPKAGGGSIDLPMPKPGGGSIDLPTPKVQNPELPAPKGFFDDLPMPAQSQSKAAELPAPKGFFDDLPMPASQAQQGNTQLPAPKGFFDDLPQAARSQGTQLPAPKGFFDDLPQASRSTTGLPQPAFEQSGVPAPGPGYLEPSGQQRGLVEPKSASAGLFDDLDMPGGHGGHHEQASPLDMGGASPELDLGHGGGSSGGDGAFDDLDLSKPSTPAARFEAPKQRDSGRSDAVGNSGGLPPVSRGMGSGDGMSLELEEPRHQNTPKLGPKKKDEPTTDPKVAGKQKVKRQRLVLGAALGIVAVGAIVGLAVKRHSAAVEREEDIEEGIGKARRALSSPTTGHWQTALSASKAVLEIDEDNVEAIGIGAEAAYAGALDDGINSAGRKSQGRNLLTKAREDGLASPDIDRALIVESIASSQWDRAIGKLEPMVKANPKDGFLTLYLGWALAGKGDLQGAMKAFDTTVQTNAALKVPALYGRGRAKLALADLKGARADFSEILTVDKDNVGAQVGLAAALTATQAPQQESDLLAILARKDIDNADPRARIEAWVLAGDDARRAGRVDAARERYHKALAIDQNDVSATTGLAETELRDNKLDVASDLILKATSAAQNDAHAQIVAAEIEIRMRKLDSAAQRIKLLADPARGLATMDKVRVKLVEGKLLEAREDDQGALAAWSEAAQLAGDLDLTPTMTAIAKLTKLQQKAADEKNDAKVAQYREQADQLLGTLGQKAEQDPALALTLGIAYLDSNDAAKAETWLRKAADARPQDPEAKYQLAKALVRLVKADDAIEQLRAAIELDPNRGDIGLELAKTYEAAGRDPDAGMMYDKLLSKKDPSVELRARAGRFWARTSQIDRAAQQGDEILKVDPHNAAGLYLRGEKLLAAAKYDDAKKFFQQAVDADRDPQYLDGQGRCAERIAEVTKDTKFQELALRAYQAAAELAPAMFNPLAGMGRVYVQREEWDKALVPLVAANKLRPDDIDVLYNMGVSLQNLGRTKEAVDWLANANKLKPTPNASNALGKLFLDQHRDADAANAYELAIKLAEEAEKDSTTNPPLKFEWLSDAEFIASTIYGSSTMNNPSRQKQLLQKFVVRGSKSQARLDEAKRLLATTLRGVN